MATDGQDGDQIDSDFDVSVVDKDGRVVVEVFGELDLATGGRLRETVMTALSTSEHGVVVVLDGVTFMDSTGLSVAIAGQRRAEALGTRFAVVCAQPQLRRLFRMTGLEQHLGLYDSLSDALAAGQDRSSVS